MRGLLILLLAAAPGAALGQVISTSARPDNIAVTIYRDPSRHVSTRPNSNWLNGFALITETRQIRIPAGEADIRFEGVAGGIIPESAIVTGLPKGVREKNQDALLLSPGSLIDRSLGKRVHIRRTSRETGEVREHDAVIRSSSDGAVVLETADGIEALRCTGVPETIIYGGVPAGLSAKPTLSVRTQSESETVATITLSYLASGFDWQADYVATLSPAGDRMDLFAWLTLVNGDETSFPQAETSAVAGKLNWGSRRPEKAQGKALQLQCWPSDTTSDVPEDESLIPPPPPPPPPMAPPPPVAARPTEDMVVTGARAAMQAEQEDLGDLKLYRIPERVTVAAQSQKQVALLNQSDVAVKRVYRQRIYVPHPESSGPVMALAVTRNEKKDGLGLPLPAGPVRFFVERDGQTMLVGQSLLTDRAIGDDVELSVPHPTGVQTEITRHESGQAGYEEVEIVVANNQDRAVPFEAVFVAIESDFVPITARLSNRKGERIWADTIPANGKATFRYRTRKRV
ncbi:DUF4139 domain-containing protein [Allosphingosinicella vermicomposti]|uniref:DUF4139 domain-containing protein n=1 Tax=Allosphingosinicella vermicomposti TaxID=614671 RepID=UPI000D0FA72B|nr:hypothetical protein [Allosphingosinicella vermicomposti]